MRPGSEPAGIIEEAFGTMFGFGETHPDYPVKVLNEREARAGAGILLFFGMIAFLNAFLKGDFFLTRLAIIVFGLDFAIRVLVNPRYAPSLVIGRFFVRKQVPEYTGAPQKRFAWGLGLAIALVMMVWVVILNQAGPVAILGCLTCIMLLFFETAFGICVGCKIYNMIWPGQAVLCPGGACEVRPVEPVQRLSIGQFLSVTATAIVIAFAAPQLAAMPSPQMGMGEAQTASGERDCTPPWFARAIGHEDMWKLHNGCV
jgi:hypothetical protein